jgi:hypothetical protein
VKRGAESKFQMSRSILGAKDNHLGVEILKKGILSKKSRNMFIAGPWALRTIYLNADNTLHYYDGKTLKGVVNMTGTVVNHIKNPSGDAGSYAFEISNISSVKRGQMNSLMLAAGSFQEAEDWVAALTKASLGSNLNSAGLSYVTFEVCSCVLLFALVLFSSR